VIIKIRAEINELENKGMTTNQKTKSWSFE
jgi:hypothetical protein